MTRAHYDVGEFGNGSKVKLVANLLVAVHNVAAAEALLLAERAGLDLGTVLAAVSDGAGTSRMFEVRGPQMVTADYADATMRVSVFGKDLQIVAAFAREYGSPVPLFSVASVFYQAALAQGRGEQDTASVHAVLRQLAGG
jgi:3-hydroxyisobutyrate dehydrogenase-like beta-hydroxyacid dehydrogenase